MKENELHHHYGLLLGVKSPWAVEEVEWGCEWQEGGDPGGVDSGRGGPLSAMREVLSAGGPRSGAEAEAPGYDAGLKRS